MIVKLVKISLTYFIKVILENYLGGIFPSISEKNLVSRYARNLRTSTDDLFYTFNAQEISLPLGKSSNNQLPPS